MTVLRVWYQMNTKGNVQIFVKILPKSHSNRDVSYSYFLALWPTLYICLCLDVVTENKTFLHFGWFLKCNPSPVGGIRLRGSMHHGTCVTHVPWCMLESLTSGYFWSRWRGKRSRHFRCMRNPQFWVSGKRPMEMTNCLQKNTPSNIVSRFSCCLERFIKCLTCF